MKLPNFIQRRPVAVRVLVVFALVAVVWATVSANRRAPLPKDCVSRLVLIDETITRWAQDYNRDNLAIPTKTELAEHLNHRSLLRCPDGGSYVLGSRSLATTCTKHGHASFAEPVPPPRSKLSDFMAEVRSYFRWGAGRVLRCGQNSCIANLKQIESAAQQWSVDAKKVDADALILSEIVGGSNYLRWFPWCPKGGKYILGTVKDPPRCTVVGHTL